jgi:hypothetical protein
VVTVPVLGTSDIDTTRGTFTVEGGRTVIRDLDESTQWHCHRTYVATKQ